MGRRVFLVVKGTAHDAETAGIRHGVKLSVLGESSNHRETYCECPMEDMNAVINWYSIDCGWGGEFETGTLLWYAERD